MPNYKDLIRGIVKLHEDTTNKTRDIVMAIRRNGDFSEEAKARFRFNELDGLRASADNLTGLAREAVQRFLAECRIDLPEDGKDHSAEIDNASRVIDILGSDLDASSVNNIIEPLKGSFRAMKTVVDVLKVKRADYAPEVRGIIDAHDSRNIQVQEFISALEPLENMLAEPYGLSFNQDPIAANIPYSILAAPGWMEKAENLREQAETEIKAMQTERGAMDYLK